MRRTLLWSVVVLLVVAGAATLGLAAWYRAFGQLQTEVKALRAERDQLAAELARSQQIAEELLRQVTATIASSDAAEPHPMVESAFTPPPPEVKTDENGRKTYFFPELYGTGGQVIARSAEFRELLGYTKLSFRTSEGIRYYDLDDVHPETIRALGYDASILKRRLADQLRQRQILGAQAQLQQELRVKAAQEFAAREQAAAERMKAEAAVRDAEARERLAEAAERAATNPPKPQRIIQKSIIVVPYDPKQPDNPPPETP